ncbi:hypothetical protein [Sporosarcina sp. NPDC096371]|uniref:hypothetical protein n=1 Tax=Sporosarcina sp. NPDC096371 TaxID=3364530 RepID=UPI0037FA2623
MTRDESRADGTHGLKHLKRVVNLASQPGLLQIISVFKVCILGSKNIGEKQILHYGPTVGFV